MHPGIKIYDPDDILLADGDLLMFAAKPPKWPQILLILLIGIVIGGLVEYRCHGAEVQWPACNQKLCRLSDVVNDVEQHSNLSDGRQYLDLVTRAHEMTHDVNQAIGNSTSADDQGLYVLNNKAFTIRQTHGITLSMIRDKLPFEGDAVITYLTSALELPVQMRIDRENRPTDVFDEWCAYCNGTAAGIELKMPVRAEFSFQHACQLGLYSCILCKMANNPDDMLTFIKYEKNVMDGQRKQLTLLTDKNWTALEAAISALPDGPSNPDLDNIIIKEPK